MSNITQNYEQIESLNKPAESRMQTYKISTKILILTGFITNILKENCYILQQKVAKTL